MMTEEQLAQYELCYRNWNGTSVGENAFANLLSEVRQLRIKVKQSCHHTGRNHGADGWHCPYCDMRGPVRMVEPPITPAGY